MIFTQKDWLKQLPSNAYHSNPPPKILAFSPTGPNQPVKKSSTNSRLKVRDSDQTMPELAKNSDRTTLANVLNANKILTPGAETRTSL